jgi:hypothetical protein
LLNVIIRRATKNHGKRGRNVEVMPMKRAPVNADNGLKN